MSAVSSSGQRDRASSVLPTGGLSENQLAEIVLEGIKSQQEKDALDVLWMVSRIPGRATELLLLALKHPSPSVRIEAIKRLSAQYTDEAKRAILSATYDADPDVRKIAYIKLFIMSPAIKEGTEEAKIVARALGDNRETAIGILGAWEHLRSVIDVRNPSRDVLRLLYDIVQSGDTELSTRAARALGHIASGGKERSPEIVARVWENASEDVLLSFLEECAQGDVDIPVSMVLEAIEAFCNYRKGVWAKRVLVSLSQRLGKPDGDAEEELLSVYNEEIPWGVISGAKKISGREAANILMQVFRDGAHNNNIRIIAVTTSLLIASRSSRWARAFLDLFLLASTDRDKTVRSVASWGLLSLASLPDEQEQVVGRLYHLATMDEDASVRALASRLIGQFVSAAASG